MRPVNGFTRLSRASEVLTQSVFMCEMTVESYTGYAGLYESRDRRNVGMKAGAVEAARGSYRLGLSS